MGDAMEPDDRFAQRFREAYEATPSPGNAARTRVEAAWRAGRRPASAIHFWLEPRAMTVRPIAALAAGMALVMIGSLVAVRIMNPPPAAPGTAAVAAGIGTTQAIRFVLVAPASSVALVGDFNGWDASATPMRRARSSDEWTTTVRLENGWHAYAFVVDGKRWVPDPSAPLAPAGDYGERRSVIVVGEEA